MKVLSNSLIAGLLLAVSGTASALPVLSFDDGGINTGSVSYDGSGGAMTGSVDFSTVTASGTSLNDGAVLSCVTCIFSFTTGGNTSEGSSALGDDWVFGPGGSLSITGTVKDGATVVASGTLLSGSFLGAGVSGALGSLRFDGIGFDTKNQDLLDFYGISGASSFIHVESTIGIGGATFDDTKGSFLGDVTSADLINAVPEPAITALLGLGLIGIGVARRRVR